MRRASRIFYSVILMLMQNPRSRTEFLKKHHLYGSIGENCSIQKPKLPLYSNLIHIHNNVKIASNVGFLTHDIIHTMLNDKDPGGGYIERIGCIEIMDNVFIGAGTRILYGTRIGTNVIIGSDSLVNKDVPDNSVYAGVPARYICTFDEYAKKAKEYSDKFKETYGISKFHGVNDDLAKRIYADFIREHEQKKNS